MLIPTAYLNPTNQCDLRCPNCCTRQSRDLDERPELTRDEYKRLLAQLWSLGYKNFDYSGGEPFLRSDLVAILTARWETGAHQIVVSNGSCVSWDKSELSHLFRYVHDIRISVDAGTADEHDQMRGPGSYERAILAIESLQSARTWGSQAIVGINTVWFDYQRRVLEQVDTGPGT